MIKKWTIIDVADRLDQAAITLKKIPKDKVQGYSSYWPEIVRKYIEAYGRESARYNKIPPSAKQITEMDEALRWLLWNDRYEAKLLWLRSCGAHWKTIQRELLWSVSKLKLDYKVALLKIVFNLNSHKPSDSYPYKKLLKMDIHNSCDRFKSF